MGYFSIFLSFCVWAEAVLDAYWVEWIGIRTQADHVVMFERHTPFSL